MKKMLILTIMLASLICKGQNKDAVQPTKQSGKNSATFLFVHGAWGGGWEYANVDSILSEKGYKVFRPTLTGVGERVHLANPDITLTTHILDIVNVIEFENLNDIVLVGHSYGGMVIAGVAELVPDRIHRMIFLDAFVPDDGESVQIINGDGVWNAMIVPQIKDGFVLYPLGPTAPISPADVPQPLKTFTEVLTVNNPSVKKIPASFILMRENGNATFEEWGAKRATANGWKVHEMEGGHYPMRDQPEKLVEKLENMLIVE